jgi:hypothetical protein
VKRERGDDDDEEEKKKNWRKKNHMAEQFIMKIIFPVLWGLGWLGTWDVRDWK